MRMGRARWGLLAGAIVLALSWYLLARPAPHEAFRTAVSEAPGCKMASECTVLRTACPLGCAHAMPVSAREELSALAERYVQRARRRDGECAQDCAIPPPVTCKAGRCVFQK